MIDEPHIAETAVQEAAVIRFTIPRAEIRQVMGPGHRELAETLAAQGLAAAGPWFSHHFRMDPEVFDFEIGFPVASPVAPAGRVRPGRLPAAMVARTVYHGGYETLGDAWGELMAWIEGQGLTPAEDLWERYLVGPESGAAPAGYQTELNRPLVRLAKPD